MNSPEKIHQFLMKSVFKAALKRETKLTNAVEKFTGNLRFDGEELIFTLPALFNFAIGYIQEESITQISDKQVEYLAFRKIVYRSGINLHLRSLQAAVVIESQHVNHDERWYRLVVLQ